MIPILTDGKTKWNISKGFKLTGEDGWSYIFR